MKASKAGFFPLIVICAILPVLAQTASNPANLPQRDGSHDFDFLIGNWKAHVRRNANFEEFDVTSTDKKLHIKAQTLSPL